MEIIVEPYPSPISYKGQYHYRSGSTKQELKGAALDVFLLKKHGLHWDGVPVPGFGVENCSEAAFNLFKTRAAKSGRVDEHVLNDSQAALLENLQLTKADYLKRAATLLFSDPVISNHGAFLFEDARESESNALTRPRTSAFYARRALELAIKWICANDGSVRKRIMRYGFALC